MTDREIDGQVDGRGAGADGAQGGSRGPAACPARAPGGASGLTRRRERRCTSCSAPSAYCREGRRLRPARRAGGAPGRAARVCGPDRSCFLGSPARPDRGPRPGGRSRRRVRPVLPHARRAGHGGSSASCGRRGWRSGARRRSPSTSARGPSPSSSARLRRSMRRWRACAPKPSARFQSLRPSRCSRTLATRGPSPPRGSTGCPRCARRRRADSPDG